MKTITNPVFETAIASVLTNQKFDTSRVRELINYAGLGDIESALRVVLYLTGQINMPEFATEVRNEKDVVLKFISYNIFNDVLEYEYMRSSTLYFDSEERAKKYAENGKYEYEHYYGGQKENYQFPGTWVRKDTSHCSAEQWKNYEQN